MALQFPVQRHRPSSFFNDDDMNRRKKLGAGTFALLAIWLALAALPSIKVTPIASVPPRKVDPLYSLIKYRHRESGEVKFGLLNEPHNFYSDSLLARCPVVASSLNELIPHIMRLEKRAEVVTRPPFPGQELESFVMFAVRDDEIEEIVAARRQRGRLDISINGR